MCSGVAILTAAVLLSVRQRLTSREYVLSFVLLVAAAAFHDSHVLDPVRPARCRGDLCGRDTLVGKLGRLLTILFALVIGILAQSVFFAAVRMSSARRRCGRRS